MTISNEKKTYISPAATGFQIKISTFLFVLRGLALKYCSALAFVQVQINPIKVQSRNAKNADDGVSKVPASSVMPASYPVKGVFL